VTGHAEFGPLDSAPMLLTRDLQPCAIVSRFLEGLWGAAGARTRRMHKHVGSLVAPVVVDCCAHDESPGLVDTAVVICHPASLAADPAPLNPVSATSDPIAFS